MKKLYIKTFGCQMNEYDSDKMADVLREASLAGGEDIVRTESPDDADVILFNTCSVREKAQEKVFSDLGRVKELKRAKPGPRDRRRRLRREPGRRGDHEARPVRRRRLRPADAAPPAAADRRAPRDRRAAGRHQLSRDREVRSPAAGDDRRRDGVRVDHGRLLEVLQLLRRALHARRGSVARLRRRADRDRRPRRAGRARGDAARAERQRVSRAVPDGVRGRADEIADFATLLEYVADIPGIERIRYTTSHPKEFTQRLVDAYARIPKLVVAPAPAGAVRVRPRADGDEARLHGARVQVDRAAVARGAAGPVAVDRHHRRLSRRDRRRLRGDDEADRGRRLRRRVLVRLQPATRHAGRGAARRRRRGDEARAPRSACRPRSTRTRSASAPRWSARASGSSSRAPRARTPRD